MFIYPTANIKDEIELNGKDNFTVVWGGTLAFLIAKLKRSLIR